MLWNILSRRMPAALNTMCSPPKVSRAWLTIARQSSNLATEPKLATASPPAALISSPVTCAGRWSPPSPAPPTPGSTTTILAPSAAISLATSAPTPRAAPVQIATRPSNMPMVRPFLECRSGSQLTRRLRLLSIRSASLTESGYRLGRATSDKRKALTEPPHPSVVIIAGPTASGKSALALELAAALGGTIINADSQQIYRDLKILSARPDASAMRRVPHRLYGFLDAAERGSVGRWRALALAEIAAAQAQGSLPFLVGGTGLYLRAIQHGLAAVPPIPAAIRAEAAALYDELGGPAFRDRLMALDPAAAPRLPSGDRQRLMPAWGVVRATGRPLGEWQRAATGPVPCRFATILMMPPREALYAACDARFAAMIAAGGVEEAAALAARG